MNQNNTQFIINVATNKDEVVNELMKSYKIANGEKITDLNTLFNVGLSHANYVVGAEDLTDIKIGNGTGYYDPLTKAVFVDENGFAISNNSSVSIYDQATRRRLYVIVLEKGENIIVHDRYSQSDDDRVILVATGNRKVQSLLNMYPCWSSGSIYDLGQCSNLFGFEFDRFKNDVYVPFSHMKNWFQVNRDQLIPNRKDDKFMPHAA